MLETGEIDALYTAAHAFLLREAPTRSAGFSRIIKAVEREYYRRTKIFPIMHAVVIRREVYEKHPWVAQSLYKAFLLAQREIYADLYETAALEIHVALAHETRGRYAQIMGQRFLALWRLSRTCTV